MTEQTIHNITTGESWACRFRTTTFLDSNGEPVKVTNLQMGQAHPGAPGEYTSIGIIQVRDKDREVVQLEDTRSHQQFVVDFEDCWDIDRIEWQE